MNLFLLASRMMSWVKARRVLAPGLKRTRDEYEFQPGYLEILERPPSPWARGIALGLTATLLMVLLWSVLGHLDIQANATGQMLVSSHSKVIQPLEIGEVTAINVHDGQRVRAGDILVSLNPVSVKAELNEQQAQLRYKRLEQARLQALLSDTPAENFVVPDGVSPEEVAVTRAHLLSTWKEVQTSLAGIDSELQVNQASQAEKRTDALALEKLENNILARLSGRRSLALSNIVSKDELLEHEKERLDTERSLAQTRAELSVLQAQAQSLQVQKAGYMAKFRHERYDELTRTHNDIDQVTAQLVKAREQERVQDLRAPVSGVVQQLAVHTLGGVVQPAQQLMVVVPEHTPLEAEVMVLNKDIGFVHEGEPVEIKVDAFPYTRYGTLHGTVIHVSKDAVRDEKLGLIFPAQVQMMQSTIEVDDAAVPLQAGMSVTADIRTGDRRVIDYLLSPLQQYKSEALRER
jgi:RTX toxin transport system membrane fusion protein